MRNRRTSNGRTGKRRVRPTIITSVFAAVTAGILWLTLAPFTPGPTIGEHGDKWGHLLMFMGWSLLYGIWMLHRKPAQPAWSIWIKVPLVGTLFGVLIELLQTALPFDRHGDVYDAMANLAGSLLAAALLHVRTRRNQPRRKRQ